MLTEIEIMTLKNGMLQLPPYSLRLIQDQPIMDEYSYYDVLIKVSWAGKAAIFIVD